MIIFRHTAHNIIMVTRHHYKMQDEKVLDIINKATKSHHFVTSMAAIEFLRVSQGQDKGKGSPVW